MTGISGAIPAEFLTSRGRCGRIVSVRMGSIRETEAREVSLDECLIQLGKGDLSVFDEIYRMTQGAVYYITLSVLRERSLAEDAMQSCYLKVIAAARRYRGGTNANAWICKIAKHEAIDLRRKRAREYSVDPCGSEHLFPAYGADGYGELIDLARKTLKEGEFSVLMLVAEGYKRREIAAMLSIPVPTVTWRYQRALDKLKEALRRRDDGTR